MNFLKSVAHPFTFEGPDGTPKVIDHKYQIRTEIATAIAGAMTFGIAAVPVFYGASAYYRWKCNKNEQNIPPFPYNNVELHTRGELLNLLVEASKANPDLSLEPFKNDLDRFFNYDDLNADQLNNLKLVAQSHVKLHPKSITIWRSLLEDNPVSLTPEQSAALVPMVEEYLKRKPQDKSTWNFLFERLTPRQWDILIQVVEKYLKLNPMDRSTWENLINIKFDPNGDSVSFRLEGPANSGKSGKKQNSITSVPISLLSAEGSVFRHLFADVQGDTSKPYIKVPLELQGIKITDQAVNVFTFLLNEGLKCNVEEQISFLKAHPLTLKDNLAINLIADYFDVHWIHGVLPEMYNDLEFVETIEDLKDCIKLSAVLMPKEINYGSKEPPFKIDRETAEQFAYAIRANHQLIALDLSCCTFDEAGLEIIKQAIADAKKKQPELKASLNNDPTNL